MQELLVLCYRWSGATNKNAVTELGGATRFIPGCLQHVIYGRTFDTGVYSVAIAKVPDDVIPTEYDEDFFGIAKNRTLRLGFRKAFPFVLYHPRTWGDRLLVCRDWAESLNLEPGYYSFRVQRLAPVGVRRLEV